MPLIVQVMTMPFRRFRGRSLRPINRIKHVVDQQGGVAAAAQSNTSLIIATDTPTLAATNQVETGSTVNGIYLKVEVNATSSAALSNVYLAVSKNVGGNLGNPTANAIGADDNKRFVIHQEMVMMQQVTNSNPRTLFNGVIVIPRGMRRFAPNDQLNIHIQSPGTSINFCYQCHYKEFR